MLLKIIKRAVNFYYELLKDITKYHFQERQKDLTRVTCEGKILRIKRVEWLMKNHITTLDQYCTHQDSTIIKSSKVKMSSQISKTKKQKTIGT